METTSVKDPTRSLVCRLSFSLTANAMCFVLVTVSNFSRSSFCSAYKCNSDYKCMYSNPSSIRSIMHPSKNHIPFIICHQKPTSPWLFKPFVPFMMSHSFILGPSKLSLLLKLDMSRVAAIGLTLELNFFNMSWCQFISFWFCSSAEESFNKDVRIMVRIMAKWLNSLLLNNLNHWENQYIILVSKKMVLNSNSISTQPLILKFSKSHLLDLKTLGPHMGGSVRDNC